MEELLNDQTECNTNLEDSVHSNNKNIKNKCSACNEEFDQNQLRVHTFQCPNLNFDIPETFRNLENIQNPNENLRPTAQIQEEVVKNFKCTLCSKNYNLSDLKNHGPEICVKAVSEERAKNQNIVHTHRHHQLANPGAMVMCFRRF